MLGNLDDGNRQKAVRITWLVQITPIITKTDFFIIRNFLFEINALFRFTWSVKMTSSIEDSLVIGLGTWFNCALIFRINDLEYLLFLVVMKMVVETCNIVQ